MFAILPVALTNLLLSSDNVLMIALMSRGVGHPRRWYALLWSLLVSVGLQLGILALMALLFRLPLLPAVFGAVICVMAFHLIKTHQPHGAVVVREGMPTTVFRITVGNLMMSFENEAALTTLARGNVWLAWAGVLTTAPIIFFGSHMMGWVLRRYPVIVYAGAVYLFHVGIGLVLSLPALRPHASQASWALTALFTVYVVVRYLSRVRPPSRGDGLR